MKKIIRNMIMSVLAISLCLTGCGSEKTGESTDAGKDTKQAVTGGAV